MRYSVLNSRHCSLKNVKRFRYFSFFLFILKERECGFILLGQALAKACRGCPPQMHTHACTAYGTDVTRRHLPRRQAIRL